LQVRNDDFKEMNRVKRIIRLREKELFKAMKAIDRIQDKKDCLYHYIEHLKRTIKRNDSEINALTELIDKTGKDEEL